MKFSANLYLGEEIKHPKIIKYKLRIHRPDPGVYVLRLAQNKSDYVEIIKGSYFFQPLAYKEDNQIVGFAKSEAEAFGLISQMMDDCLEATNDVNLRKYLIEKSKTLVKG